MTSKSMMLQKNPQEKETCRDKNINENVSYVVCLFWIESETFSCNPSRKKKKKGSAFWVISPFNNMLKVWDSRKYIQTQNSANSSSLTPSHFDLDVSEESFCS